MHISEGILSAEVLTAGAAIAVLGTGLGLKKINPEKMVHVAMLSSAFFVASLIHINIGPASVHLILNGVVGILLGFAAIPAILSALILQSVFFQYGGLTALGVNLVIMAVPAVLCHYLFRPLLGKTSKWTFAAGFAAGFSAIFFSAILLGGALWLTDKHFWATSAAVITAYLPVMAIEGVVTGFALNFLVKVYPEIIPQLGGK